MLSQALSDSQSPCTLWATSPLLRGPVWVAPGSKLIQGYFCGSHGTPGATTETVTYRKSVNTHQAAEVPRLRKTIKRLIYFHL